MNEKKKSFILYLDRKKELSLISNEQAGILFKALFDYVDSGELLDSDDMAVKLLFSMFTTQIDANAEKYEKTCQKRSENQRKRWEKKKSVSEDTKNTTVYKDIQTDTKNTDTDTETDTDTVTETVTDTDTEIYPNGYINYSGAGGVFEMISEYTENAELQETLMDFVEMREKINKPPTRRAMKLCLSKLDKLYTSDSDKIACIEQSIERCWQTFYALNDQKKGGATHVGNTQEWDNRFGTLV